MRPPARPARTPPIRAAARMALVAGILLPLTACFAPSRRVPVSSECPGTVRVRFEAESDSFADPIDVGPDGTTLRVSDHVARVWFVAADGTVLNEVSLTADQAADNEADFPTLVIRSEDCDRLEAVS